VTRTPIADYALLSDCHSAALVGKDGSVDWLCFPRFDSPSVFARILDNDAGHWSIRPTADAEVTRMYRERTMILETTFTTDGGTVVLTGAMATGHNEGHALGAQAPHVLLRKVECTAGQVELEMECGPVPEYGLVFPIFRPVEGGMVARGGAHVLALSSPVPLEEAQAEVRALFTLREGESAAFALQYRPSWRKPPRIFGQDDIDGMLVETTEAWRNWSKEHQNYDGPWRDLVYRSGSVLQALTYQPTGAIVAAPTTSLPEAVGGMRNWDYRYAWVRDASFTLDALWVAACRDEAQEFFEWMAGAAAAQVHWGSELQIMFGVGGEHDLTERDLPHLTGWRDSKPVRVGNGAWNQKQLDVYGELINCAHRFIDYLEGLDPSTAHFLIDAANAAADGWEEQDNGIWEVRGEPRDFTYSKVMCWVALDRAITLADRLDAGDHVERWTEVRDEIREAILERAWSEAAGAFTQAFGSDDLDASLLQLPIVGFLPPDDPRILATIDAIEERLTDDRGLVYRYLAPDGLPGEEGTFLLCTFWLAQAQAMAGRTAKARETFERAVAYANDVGLLAEEVDPKTGELLGNFPQAFSHIGLVNAAWAISEAERGRKVTYPSDVRRGER
jgi:GH15 family glucan-1,4-alpha-glucosidase